MISGFKTSARLTLMSAIFSSSDMFAPGLTNEAAWAFCNLDFASLSCVCASSILFSMSAISCWIAAGSAIVSAVVGYEGQLVCQLTRDRKESNEVVCRKVE